MYVCGPTAPTRLLYVETRWNTFGIVLVREEMLIPRYMFTEYLLEMPFNQ